ncbi:UDP-N-acetylmuramoyl-L-alanyl-D-glutamate--2,6-diaminopimelate ligase [Limnohabitans curvus]|uniref:UDP-N-acetylmuramoyl-L-alanyl-D-glutamate--2,6-diaminopimelate ligase n=1 Tax=Limnohabitans curvus TaxID=323423 RepID=A0A315ESK3_9BURK|nr:UDP-N-acetylmuramoyl-L-alanyl-D-glutamate--2,6-diaminopimelate ligase [Limnohabitans curvus]PUE59755.1 UDP-N-acetylmuramoyl-L-alanyl-D-glutamate--2,6-diaminopimelate ligase [Limnohabitans curvus]
MKRLHNPQDAAQWLRTQVRGVLHTDSRRVGAGDGFIAWPGGVTDGRQFVASALKQGATACVVEHSGAEAFAWGDSEAIATYDGLKAASGPIAAAYYEQPSHALDVLAITGTNGKTSTAWWLAHALQNAGKRCAMVGTLGVGEVGHLEVTGMTTPDPVLLQARLRAMVEAGVNACAIEASSIGLAEHRLDGTQVRVAMFTNFTQDHLDYHGDMTSYWQAKLALFSWAGLQAAVVNVDDAQGAALAVQLQARGDVHVWTVSCAADATMGSQHIVARHIQHGARGLCFEVVEGEETHMLDTQLVGLYNVSNVLGVIACMRALGYSLADAVQACRVLPAVPGRMQTVGEAGEPLVVIDYAHTPDAVAQAVQALLPLAQSRGGELTCVLGCGGDRDAAKRPLMAAAAEQYAQHVVLTSDNPRSEDPQTILNHMLAGLKNAAKTIVVADRAQAIAQTVQRARAQDVVLVAGKGHEDYQEIAGVKYPFSDVQHARDALAQRGAHV